MNNHLCTVSSDYIESWADESPVDNSEYTGIGVFSYSNLH